jgi:hypothetical protein
MPIVGERTTVYVVMKRFTDPKLDAVMNNRVIGDAYRKKLDVMASSGAARQSLTSPVELRAVDSRHQTATQRRGEEQLKVKAPSTGSII